MREIFLYIYVALRAQILGFTAHFKDVVKDLSKGEYTWFTSDDGITAILWHDTVPQFLSNFHNPEEESSVFRRTRERETTSPCGVAGGGRLQQVHGWRQPLDSLRYCNMQHHVNEVVARVILVDSDTAMVNASRVLVEEQKVGRTPMNRFDFIQSVVEELKHDGVHYNEDTVENAPVCRKRASLDAKRDARGQIRLPWIDALDANCWKQNMSNPVLTACRACESQWSSTA